MTDAAALRKALERADGACPCAVEICGCGCIHPDRRSECEPCALCQPLHAAIREAMRAAAEWGAENYYPSEFGMLTVKARNKLAAILGPERKEE